VHATRRGWPTQSSTAAIASLCALAAALARRYRRGTGERIFDSELKAIPALVDEVAAKFDRPAHEAAVRWAAARIVLFTGAGPHFGAAAFGAAKVKELSPIHAIALPLEEYHHYRSQKPGDPLFLVAPDQASAERAFDTVLVSQKVKGDTIALVPESEAQVSALANTAWHLPLIRPELAPIVYSIPLHLFSYHFAKARFEKGFGYPGAFPDIAA
jgi:glucosamine 6-phosphate synthetase-like amidotransferase/phosphosugar isomerase protein